MSAFAKPLLSLIAILRALAARGESGPVAIEAAASQALAFFERVAPDDPLAPRLGAQLALALSALAAQAGQEGDGRNFTLLAGSLPRCGAAGEIALAGLCRSPGVDVAVAVGALEGLPAGTGLALIDRLLKLPRGAAAELVAWAEARLDDLWAGDPEEIMAFMAVRGGEGQPVCHAVQNRLMRGRFGIYLEKLLKIELRPPQLEFLANVAACLESDKVHARLAKRLAPEPGRPVETDLAILSALAASAPKDHPGIVKAVRPLLKHPVERLRAAAARTLIALCAPEMGPSLLRLFEDSQDGGEGLFATAARLAPEDFFALLKGLSPQPRRDLLSGLTLLSGAIDPDWLEETLEKVAPASGLDAGRLVAAVKAFALARRRRDEAPEGWPAPAPVREEPVRERCAGPAPGTGRERLADVSWRGLEIEALEFAGAEIAGLDAAGAAIGKALFRDCLLAGADFSGAVLTGAVFENCRLRACDFSDAELRNCRFTDCVIDYTDFAGARLCFTTLDGCRLGSCCLYGARLESALCGGCSLGFCDFSFSWWLAARFTACDFTDCLFDRPRLEHSEVRGGRSTGTRFAGAAFTGFRGDEPAFMEAAERSLWRAVDSGEAFVGAPRPGPDLSSSNGVLLMSRLAERWFFERDLSVRLRRLLANNRRRLDWAMAKMDERGRDFLDLLPGLVEAGRVPGSPAQAPAVRFGGRCAGYAARRRLADELADAPARGDKAAEVLPAEALFVMGSCGTIAQNAASDVDVWLCIDEAVVPRTQAGRLRAKLAALEKYAEEAFDLEVHFFLMDLNKILTCDFGFSDEESSGSAQSMLLKEEFYRTSMWLAGKKPAWWFMPPGATKAAYAARLKRLRQGEGAQAGEVIDLGQIDEADRSEFFGASLWQIVKALKSPFKSVLKFGLLEKYYMGRGGEPLLCDRIKDDLAAGRLGLWETDPYAVLFKELYEYYKRSGRDDAKKLMGLAFRQKSGLFAAGDERGREGTGASFLEHFFPPAESRLAAEIRSATLTDAAERRASRLQRFADMLTLGDMIGQFMFSTYESIQSRLRSPEEDLVINEHDLTKVGRRLFSQLKPRKNKIMRIAFVSSPEDFFASLEFSCEVTPGGGPAWVAKGLARTAGGKPRAEEVRRDPSIVSLGAWLAANRVYRPGMHLHCGQVLPPVTLDDIRALIEAVTGAFPTGTTFDPPLSESLLDERIVKTLMVLNFQAPREEKRLREAFAIYATNWGEMFCLPCQGDLAGLERAPEKFLAEAARMQIEADFELAVFKPAKSQCMDLFFL
jgi:adenylate cyclase, class 1